MEILKCLLLVGIVQAEVLTCLEALNRVFEAGVQGTQNDYARMYHYSGKSINDLGRFDKCKEVPTAQYVFFEVFEQPAVITSLCGPKQCTTTDYSQIISNFTSFQTPNFKVHFPSDSEHSSKNVGKNLLVVIFCMLVFLCVVGTFVDSSSSSYLTQSIIELQPARDSPLFENNYYLEKLKTTLVCFSLNSNLSQLFSELEIDRIRGAETLNLVKGTVVLSFLWLLLGNIAAEYLSSTVCSNITEFPSILSAFYTNIIYSSLYSLDFICWVLGFLLSYNILKKITLEEFEGFITNIVCKLAEVMPLLAFLTFSFWSFQEDLGSGPMWHKTSKTSEDCSSYWWANFLFVNNFLPRMSECLTSSWFLSMTIQLYLVSLPIIYCYVAKKRKLGWNFVLVLNLVMVLDTLVIADHYQLNLAIVGPTSKDLMKFYYIKPYCRMGPYLLGVGSGFVVFSYKYFETFNIVFDTTGFRIAKLFQKFWFRCFCLKAGTSLLGFLVFFPYSVYSNPGDNFTFDNWPQEAHIAWLAFNRLLLGISITLILLPMLLGYFRVLSGFLSLGVWNPFFNIIVCALLINKNVISILYKSQQTALYLSAFNLIKDSIGAFFLIAGVSVPIVLLVETPFKNLHKLFSDSHYKHYKKLCV